MKNEYVTYLNKLLEENNEKLLHELITIGKEKFDDGDTVISQGKHLWVLDDETFEEVAPKIEQELGIDKTDDLYELEDVIRENHSDVILGTINGSGLSLKHLNWRHQGDSPALKKVMKSLGLSYITVNVFDEVTEDDDEIRDEIGNAKFYHGTSYDALIQMKSKGLAPQFTSNFNEIVHPDKVFVTANIEKAYFHAMNAARKQNSFPVIIEVKIPDPNKLVMDYDVAVEFLSDDNPELDELEYNEIKGNLGVAGRGTIEVINRIEKHKTDISKMLGVFGYKGRIPASHFENIIYAEEALTRFIQANEYGEGIELTELGLDPLDEWIEEKPVNFKKTVEEIQDELAGEEEEEY